MNKNFVPEMHDIGKLIPSSLQCQTTDGKAPIWHGRNAFANVDWDKLGISEPQTATWQAICHHHDGKYADLRTSPAPAEVKADILRLMIADHLAATASRAVPEKVKVRFPRRTEVLELWNPEEPAEEQPWSPVRSVDDLKELIEFINSDPPDASAFFAKYGKYLANIPEDKTPPQVITSLKTHVELVGKFFKVLKTHVQVDNNADPKQLHYGEAMPISATRRAEKTWRFKLLRCKLSFPQIPVRARDLNVFYVLEQLTEKLAQSPQYGKYLLFHTTDTLWLFLPTDGRVTAAQILAPYLERGFYVESEEIEFTPDTFYPDLRTWLEQYPQRRQRLVDEIARVQAELEAKRAERTRVKAKLDSTETPREEKKALGERMQELGAEIKALEAQIEELERIRAKAEDEHQTIEESGMKPEEGSLYAEAITERELIDSTVICELCQSREAMEEPWVDPEGRLVEYLCEVCRRIREEPHWYHKLYRWEAEEPDTQVAWVKLTLDYEAANRVIRRLFDSFVDQLVERFQGSFALAENLKLNFRSIAALADLTKAYQAFLAHFAQGLREPHDGGVPLFLDEDIQEIAGRFKDFYIVRLMASEEIAGIVQLFRDLLREHFAACMKDTPIRLAISAAPIKFPFFEHWRYFQQPHDKPINIQRVGKARLSVNFEEWRHLETIQLHQRRVSSFLHSLARIEAVTGSRILTQAALMEQKRRLPDLVNLYTLGGLDVGTILAYYKILRD